MALSVSNCRLAEMKIAVYIIIITLSFLTNTNARETLRLGVYTDLTGFLPAMELALKTIEDDKTLPFIFNVTLNDSMVSRGLCSYTKLLTSCSYSRLRVRAPK